MNRWWHHLSNADRGCGVWVLCVLFGLGCLANVVWGEPLLDEGWYIYAGQLLAHGRLPYRDFFYPQAPLAALAFTIVAPFGTSALWAARALCAVMGIAAVALTVRGAGRLGGRTAQLWAAVLLVTSYAFSYDMATARCCALAALLGAGAFERLTSDRGNGTGWLTGTAILSLTVAARASALPVLVIVAAAGLWQWRKRALWFFAAAVLPGALMAVPFIWLGGDRFWFGLFDFHNSYYGRGMHARLAREFARGVLHEQPTAVLMGGLALIAWLVLARRTRPLTPTLRVAGTALLSWIALLILHVTRAAPFPHHQTMFLPLLALGTGLTLAAWRPNLRAWVPAAVLGMGAIVSWGRWPRWNGERALTRTAHAAQLVRQVAGGQPVLSFDPTLAVMAGSPLLDGFEMGVFGYWPIFSEARAWGGRNRDDLRRVLLAASVPVIALQMPDLKLIEGTGGPETMQALARNYREVGRVPRYGQWQQDLVIFRARNLDP